MTDTYKLTDAQAKKLVWDHIESCLDVNSSWRELLSQQGLLHTLELDHGVDDFNDLVVDVAEEHELPVDVVVEAWVDYLEEYRLWTPDLLVSAAWQGLYFLQECASADEIVSTWADFAEREKRPDVLEALKKEVEAEEDEGWKEQLLEELAAL